MGEKWSEIVKNIIIIWEFFFFFFLESRVRIGAQFFQRENA